MQGCNSFVLKILLTFFVFQATASRGPEFLAKDSVETLSEKLKKNEFSSSWFGEEEAVLELKGMKLFEQPPSSLWCWATVYKMAYQYRKGSEKKLCSIVSDFLDKACCLDFNSCNRGADLEAVTQKIGGLHFAYSTFLTSEVDEALRAGKVPVMLLYNDSGSFSHYAIIQAKLKDSSYRVFDPYWGKMTLSPAQMKSRYVHKGFVWAGTSLLW